MSGQYILIRALGSTDEESFDIIQYLMAKRLRTASGAFTMTSFTLEEDESPVVLAKRLIRSEDCQGAPPHAS